MIFSVGSNSFRSTSLVLSPSLVDKGAIFSAAADVGNFFWWSRWTLAVIYDSGRYFEISFSVSPGHVVKDPYLISWSRARLFGQHRILWLKIANYCFDVGRYTLGCRGAIFLMLLHKRGSSMFACLLFCYGWWIGNCHNPFVGSW